jgi:hypothetical protein
MARISATLAVPFDSTLDITAAAAANLETLLQLIANINESDKPILDEFCEQYVTSILEIVFRYPDHSDLRNTFLVQM